MADTPSIKWLVGKKAIATALGVSVSTVERLKKRYGKFPAHKKGGHWYTDPADLDRWVKSNDRPKGERGEVVSIVGGRKK